MSVVTTSVHQMDARSIKSIKLPPKLMHNRDKSIKSLFIAFSNQFEHGNEQKTLREATTSSRTKKTIQTTQSRQLSFNFNTTKLDLR